MLFSGLLPGSSTTDMNPLPHFVDMLLWRGHRFDFITWCKSWVLSTRFQWGHHVYTWCYNPELTLLVTYALGVCTQTSKAPTRISGLLPSCFLTWITKHLPLPYSFYFMPTALRNNWIHRFTWVLSSLPWFILFSSAMDKFLFILG